MASNAYAKEEGRLEIKKLRLPFKEKQLKKTSQK